MQTITPIAPLSTPGAAGITPQAVYNVKDRRYGAKGDVKQVTDAAWTTGTGVLTSATAAFTAGDVGKLVAVQGAGAAGVVLTTTIASYQSATQVTTAATSGTTVSTAGMQWGTDDTTAIAAAITAANNAGAGIVYLPQGTFYISAVLSLATSGVSLVGDGMECTRLLWAPAGVWTTAGMVQVVDQYNQRGNNLRDLTIDGNGQNAATVPLGTPLVSVGSRSAHRCVGVCNRPGYASATSSTAITGWAILAQGHDIDFEECWIHDDAYVATTMVLGANLVVGATSATLVSATGFQPQGHMIIDPSVSVYSTNAIAASSQTITPFAVRANPWTNGGQSSAMRGIFFDATHNQQLVVGSGQVCTVVVNNGGSGFTSGTYPTQPFTGGASNTGGGATATVVVTGGVITSVVVNQASQGAGNTNAAIIANGAVALSLTGMGAGSGQTLTVTTDVTETVSVTAATNTTFTATFAYTHPQHTPISYTGTTETVKISSIAGNVITIAAPGIQIQHNTGGTYAVISVPFTSDGIGCGQAHWFYTGYGHQPIGISVRRTTFENLGSEGFGSALARDILLQQCTTLNCVSGTFIQDTFSARVVDNVFDASGMGLLPYLSGANNSSPFWCGIAVYNQAPEWTLAETDIVIARNHVTGWTYGVNASSLASSLENTDSLLIDGNTLRGQGLSAICVAQGQSVHIHNNAIRNPNRRNLAVDPVIAGDVPAILLSQQTATQKNDSTQISGNSIVCDDANMKCGIGGLGSAGNWGKVRAWQNAISGSGIGSTHRAIQWNATYPIKCWDNEGFNPLSKVLAAYLDTTQTNVCSPTVAAGAVAGVIAAPTAPTSAAPTAGGAVDNGSHVWAVTFVQGTGQETNIGASSAAQTMGSGNNTEGLTGIPVGTQGTTARNIYRSKAGTTTPLFFLHQLADNSTAIWTDSVADSALGAQAPATNTSGVYTNVSGVTVEVCFVAGTLSALNADFLGVGIASGASRFTLPHNSTIAVTWSVQPTWQWYGL